MTYRQNNITGDIPFVFGGMFIMVYRKGRDVVKENVDNHIEMPYPFLEYHMYKCKKYI